MGIAAGLFALTFLIYALTAVSVRMITAASYLGVGVANAGIAALAFLMVVRVAASPTPAAFLGYVAGAVAGSLTGLWVLARPKGGT